MQRTNRTILHIDDDPSILLFTKTMLEKKGFDVISLKDPTRALDELTETGCRVVLLDIDMPQLSGLDLLPQIKEYDGGIQVIMLTGVVTQNTLLESMRLGAECCVFKPIEDIATIVESIEGAFGKVDRWWRALKELRRRKKVTECL